MDSHANQTKIAVQVLLENICGELFALGARLQDVERTIFSIETAEELRMNLVGLQDMDLIIQQLNDLGRAIRVASHADFDELMLPAAALGETLHLADLRCRLMGLSEERVLSAPMVNADVQLF